MEYLQLTIGFILLMIGAEIFIRGAVAIAQKISMSPLVIGLTVLALGTSAPELVVSIKAAVNNSPGIALGNMIGSNIANILLVLALTAVIYPVKCRRREFIRDYSFMNIITLLFAVLCLTKMLTMIHGIIMIALLMSFIVYNYFDGKKKGSANNEVEGLSNLAQKSWFFIITAAVIGLSGVLGGADFLVRGAVTIAQNLGISEEVIGLTVIAFGTSLPELATSLVAAFRHQNDMALGNIIGSNIWNILLIMGVASIMVPIKIPLQIAQFDVWIMMASSLILLPLMIKNNQLGRMSGIVLVISYFIYVYTLYLKAN